MYNTTKSVRGRFFGAKIWTGWGHRLDERAREQFLKCIRDALNHLQDPSFLRRSPLAAMFEVANRSDTPAALQRVLAEAIQSLEPASGEPPDSRAWRMYESVFYRYVEGFSQQDVADQLGMSVRQLRREQRASFEALAYKLWDQHDVGLKWDGLVDSDGSAMSSVDAAALHQELAWLRDTVPEAPTNPSQVLPAVVNLAEPMAAQHDVCLQAVLAPELPLLAVDPIAARQALLNLLSVAIGRAHSGSTVRLSAGPLAWDVEIRLRCDAVVGRSDALPNERASLDIARRLANICGGRLTVATGEETFEAALVFPALEQLPVLAIDDNVGTLRLLQRYTAGTRYRLVGTRDPDQVLDLAGKLHPQAIVLDVMMPRTDGWEILGRLREHPRTQHIPVIVCTILAQEELALSLGARDFVRKPVTRQALLAALDRQFAPGGTVSG